MIISQVSLSKNSDKIKMHESGKKNTVYNIIGDHFWVEGKLLDIYTEYCLRQNFYIEWSFYMKYIFPLYIMQSG